MRQQLAKIFSMAVVAFGCGRGTVYTQAPVESFYALSATDINGQPFSFAQLKGHKVMVVNTASECGFTPQYKKLEELYEAYKDKGFVVIGFPSNDFGGQEPGDEKAIAAFCTGNYGVTFPMMSKVVTKGEHQHPVYQWKFLINEDGSLHSVLGSPVGPMSEAVTGWIEGRK